MTHTHTNTPTLVQLYSQCAQHHGTHYELSVTENVKATASRSSSLSTVLQGEVQVLRASFSSSIFKPLDQVRVRQVLHERASAPIAGRAWFDAVGRASQAWVTRSRMRANATST